jgi:hypothetical protein
MMLILSVLKYSTPAAVEAWCVDCLTDANLCVGLAAKDEGPLARFDKVTNIVNISQQHTPVTT